MVPGYNISLQMGSKTLLGRTQDDLNISAVIKESITKDDGGVRKRAVTGHDVTFRVSALLSLNSGSSTTQLDRDDVIAMALNTGSSAIVAVTYSCAGGDTYTCNAVITGYSESSSADPETDTTVALDLQSTGAFTKVA